MTTQELLITTLEAAIEEQPQNKSLHRSIGSVLNRYFKSKENMEMVRELTSSVELGSNVTVNQGTNNSGYVPYSSQKKTLRQQPPTYKPKPVVGSAIDETLNDLESMLKDGDPKGEDKANLPDGAAVNDLANENTVEPTDELTEQSDETNGEGYPQAFKAPGVWNVDAKEDDQNEFLTMTTEEYLKVYGSLADLKRFAAETLNLDFPKNATADAMVTIIKDKIRSEEISNS